MMWKINYFLYHDNQSGIKIRVQTVALYTNTKVSFSILLSKSYSLTLISPLNQITLLYTVTGTLPIMPNMDHHHHPSELEELYDDDGFSSAELAYLRENMPTTSSTTDDHHLAHNHESVVISSQAVLDDACAVIAPVRANCRNLAVVRGKSCCKRNWYGLGCTGWRLDEREDREECLRVCLLYVDN